MTTLETHLLWKGKADCPSKAVLSPGCVFVAAEVRVYFCIFRDTSSSESEDSSDSSDDELIGPPLPPKVAGEPDHLMEQDILGPLPPPLCDEDDNDDDGDDEGDDEEEVSLSGNLRVPWRNEYL